MAAKWLSEMYELQATKCFAAGKFLVNQHGERTLADWMDVRLQSSHIPGIRKN
jgi:hypothetical protein